MLFLVCVFFCGAPFSREIFSLLFSRWQKNLCFATKKKSLDFCSLFVSVLLRFFLLNKKEEEEEQSGSKDDRKKKKRARLRDDSRALGFSARTKKPRRRSKRERKSGVKTENFVTSPFKEKEQYYPQRRLKRRERERDKDE